MKIPLRRTQVPCIKPSNLPPGGIGSILGNFQSLLVGVFLMSFQASWNNQSECREKTEWRKISMGQRGILEPTDKERKQKTLIFDVSMFVWHLHVWGLSSPKFYFPLDFSEIKFSIPNGNHIYIYFFLTSHAWKEAVFGTTQSRPIFRKKRCLQTGIPLFSIPGHVKWKFSDVSAGIYGSVELGMLPRQWSIKQTKVTVSSAVFCHISRICGKKEIPKQK